MPLKLFVCVSNEGESYYGIEVLDAYRCTIFGKLNNGQLGITVGYHGVVEKVKDWSDQIGIREEGFVEFENDVADHAVNGFRIRVNVDEYVFGESSLGEAY